MPATNDLNLAAMTAAGADTTTLAHALVVGLFSGTPVPSRFTGWADLTEATFAGYAALTAAAATRTVGYDPLTGDVLVIIPPPAGGWTFTSTGTPSPAQIIGGFWIGNDTLGFSHGKLLEVVSLVSPITINAPSQVIELPPINVRLLANGLQS